jgi:hypothetical protein
MLTMQPEKFENPKFKTIYFDNTTSEPVAMWFRTMKLIEIKGQTLVFDEGEITVAEGFRLDDFKIGEYYQIKAEGEPYK